MTLSERGSDLGAGRQVTFARDVFDVEAIKRAAYRLSDCLAVDIRATEHEYHCRLFLLDKTDPAAIDALIDRFRGEVLDQDLRIRIARETEAYRNLILSLAFSKTGTTG